MFIPMGVTNPENLGNGGTIDGDLVITGDLQVSGGGSLSFDEIIEGTQVIDVTSTEALLVRKNGDGGDILTVDTTNSKVIATELDISGNIDVDGVTNLDAVDIDGDVDISGSITNATWTGDVIASAYLDSDTAHLSGTQTFSGSKTFSANTIISSTNQLQFGDDGTYIHQSADGVLDLVSDTEIEINATTIDVNGAMEVSGVLTASDDLVVSDELRPYEIRADGTSGIRLANSQGGIVGYLGLRSSGNYGSGLKLEDDIGSVIFGSDSDYSAKYDSGSDALEIIEGITSASETVLFSLSSSTTEVNTATTNFNGTAINFESTSSDAPILTIKNTHSGTGSPRLYFNHASSSPADNDEIGQIRFYGLNDAGTPVSDVYAKIKVNQADVSSGSEDGKMSFELMQAGSNLDILTLESIGATFSNNVFVSGDSKLYFGDTGTYLYQSADGVLDLVSDTEIELTAGLVDINTTTLDINGTAINFESSSADSPTLTIKNTHGGSGSPQLHFNHDSGSPADNDELAKLIFYGDDSAGNSDGFASISVHATAVTSGSESSKITFNNCSGGTFANSFVLDGDSKISLSNNDSGTSNTVFGKSAGNIDSNSNYNTFVGENCSDASMNGATSNTAIGYSSASGLTSGDNNVMVGSTSGQSATTSSKSVYVGARAGEGANHNHNTYVGYEAGLVSGNSDNTAVGYLAMGSGSNGYSNVAIGREALKNTTGHMAVAVGEGSMQENTSGQYNVAVGWSALRTNVDGDKNTAVGYKSLYTFEADTDGHGTNTALGWESGMDLTTGTDSCLIGANAGGNLTDGDQNTALGSYALAQTIAASSNSTALGFYACGAGDLDHGQTTAVGAMALAELTGGEANTAVGYQALKATTIGDFNTAVGHNALLAHVGGDGNVAVGSNALLVYNGNTNEGNNTAIGFDSLKDCNTGQQNSAIGTYSGQNITSGGLNTMLGWNAGATLTDGGNNICIGESSNVSASGATGQIAIGKGVSCTGDNKITVGISANTATLDLDGSDTSWAAASSDERLKENIEASSAGLAFINDLNPVTYNWKRAKDVEPNMPQYKESEEPVLGHQYGEKLHGFIAQEVKEAIDSHTEIADGFKMWKMKDDGTQTVADGNLIPILVKAVQELSAKVTELENRS